MRKLLIGVCALVSLYWLVTVITPNVVAQNYNKVRSAPPYQFDAATLETHENYVWVDLHADSLLWERDLSEHSDHGHVDIPRLREARVGFQVFGVVTKSPQGQNFTSNSADTDRITGLVIAQGWPPSTWSSLLARAVFQADKLDNFVAQSSLQATWVTNQAQLAHWSKHQAEMTGVFLGLEGAHALEGKVDNLSVLFEKGYRMVGLAHFFDNEMAGSAHGIEKYGLTETGLEMVTRAQQMGMIIDLAHASNQSIADTLKVTTKPVVVSHGGARAVCPGPRNLSDEQIRGIAKTGGVIGVGYFKGATCGSDWQAVVATILHIRKLVGIEHVALGSDFDGAVTTPTDVTGLPQLTKALVEAGLSEQELNQLASENFVRVLRKVLPEQ